MEGNERKIGRKELIKWKEMGEKGREGGGRCENEVRREEEKKGGGKRERDRKEVSKGRTRGRG